jgi:hypothetical protein
LFYFDAVLCLLQTFQTFQRISRTYDFCKWQILAAIPSPGMHIWERRQGSIIYSQAVALLTCMRKVPSSNLGQYAEYPDRFFMVFLSPSRIVLEIGPQPLPFISFPIH